MWSFGGLRSALCKCLTETVAVRRTAVCTQRVASGCTHFHSSVTQRRLDVQADGDDHTPRFVTGYESVEELKNADVQVQQIFSLDMANQREHNKAIISDTISKLQRRAGDTGSTPVQIAVLTVRIKHLTEHVKKNRKDYSCLRTLVQLVQRRRTLLMYLRRTSLPGYLQTVSDLGLKHPITERYPKKTLSQQNRAAMKQKARKKKLSKKSKKRK